MPGYDAFCINPFEEPRRYVVKVEKMDEVVTTCSQIFTRIILFGGIELVFGFILGLLIGGKGWKRTDNGKRIRHHERDWKEPHKRHRKKSQKPWSWNKPFDKGEGH